MGRKSALRMWTCWRKTALSWGTITCSRTVPPPGRPCWRADIRSTRVGKTSGTALARHNEHSHRQPNLDVWLQWKMFFPKINKIPALPCSLCQGEVRFTDVRPMGIFRFWRNGEFPFSKRCGQTLYFSRSPPTSFPGSFISRPPPPKAAGAVRWKSLGTRLAPRLPSPLVKPFCACVQISCDPLCSQASTAMKK